MVRAVMVPTVYRVIASGDVVPVFDSPNDPVWLLLADDGTVTWATTPPAEEEPDEVR